MHFLSLFHKGVVLRDTFQGQLFHQVNDVRLSEPLVFERFDCNRKRRRVQQNLSVLRAEINTFAHSEMFRTGKKRYLWSQAQIEK